MSPQPPIWFAGLICRCKKIGAGGRMLWTRRKAIAGCGGVLVWLTGSPARADAYPSQTIKLIVPYPAGGTTDLLGRMISDELQIGLGGTVIVENRPGAGTTIAAEQVGGAARRIRHDQFDGLARIGVGTGRRSREPDQHSAAARNCLSTRPKHSSSSADFFASANQTREPDRRLRRHIKGNQSPIRALPLTTPCGTATGRTTGLIRTQPSRNRIA